MQKNKAKAYLEEIDRCIASKHKAEERENDVRSKLELAEKTQDEALKAVEQLEQSEKTLQEAVHQLQGKLEAANGQRLDALEKLHNSQRRKTSNAGSGNKAQSANESSSTIFSDNSVDASMNVDGMDEAAMRAALLDHHQHVQRLVREKDRQCEQYKAELDKVLATLQHNEFVLKDQREHHQKLKEHVHRVTDKCDALAGANRELTAKNAKANAQLEANAGKLAEKDTELGDTQKKLTDARRKIEELTMKAEHERHMHVQWNKDTDTYSAQLREQIVMREKVISDKEKMTQAVAKQLEHHKLLLQAEIRRHAKSTMAGFVQNEPLPDIAALASPEETDRWIERLHKRYRKQQAEKPAKKPEFAHELEAKVFDLKQEVEFYIREILYFKLDIKGYKHDIKKLQGKLDKAGGASAKVEREHGSTRTLKFSPSPEPELQPPQTPRRAPDANPANAADQMAPGVSPRSAQRISSDRYRPTPPSPSQERSGDMATNFPLSTPAAPTRHERSMTDSIVYESPKQASGGFGRGVAPMAMEKRGFALGPLSGTRAVKPPTPPKANVLALAERETQAMSPGRSFRARTAQLGSAPFVLAPPPGFSVPSGSTNANESPSAGTPTIGPAPKMRPKKSKPWVIGIPSPYNPVGASPGGAKPPSPGMMGRSVTAPTSIPTLGGLMSPPLTSPPLISPPLHISTSVFTTPGSTPGYVPHPAAASHLRNPYPALDMENPRTPPPEPVTSYFDGDSSVPDDEDDDGDDGAAVVADKGRGKSMVRNLIKGKRGARGASKDKEKGSGLGLGSPFRKSDGA